MTTTPKLDRAIRAAQSHIGFSKETRDLVAPQDRRFAAALILDFVADMRFVEPCDKWADGFNAAIDEIKRLASKGGQDV